MEYRPLGRTGVKVSSLGLGTSNFADPTPEKECIAMVDRAIEAGINLIDTGDSYANGECERIIGKALSLNNNRQKVLLATKVHYPMGPGPNDRGNSRLYILRACEDSLRRLGTDYIDLYQTHRPALDVPLDETLGALTDLVRQGKVRYIACSNYEAWRLSEAMAISERNNWARFECYQPLYNLVTRDIEDELIPLCQYKGVGVVTWAPLGGGYLSGKYKPGELTLVGTRSEENWAYPSEFFAPNANEILQTLLDVAQEQNRSPAQVAVRWVVESDHGEAHHGEQCGKLHPRLLGPRDLRD